MIMQRMMMQRAADDAAQEEDFDALLDESFGGVARLEGVIVRGRVTEIIDNQVFVDVGLKSYGRIDRQEFVGQGESDSISAGDTVEVYIERLEGRNGEAVLSRARARREEAWCALEEAFEKGQPVKGLVVSRVKGGLTVEVMGTHAFLPGSQVDVRPVRDLSSFLQTEHEFSILKMDRARGNIVVSRRTFLEKSQPQRSDPAEVFHAGMVVKGVVKNLTDYGAFVDLGGIDGLLHVTDMRWRRVHHPSDFLHVGQQIEAQILRINPENRRISLGTKQLQEDPWKNIQEKYPPGSTFSGRVTNLTDYGAFVELLEGVEGLIHVSEMSWTRKNLDPGKLLSLSQEVTVKVLSVDEGKRRISLGLKQCVGNPWEMFRGSHKSGEKVTGTVRGITEFGIFVSLSEELDGLVHISDLSWEEKGDVAIKKYKVGDSVEVKILDINVAKERISLGIKQLALSPQQEIADKHKKGDIVTCTVEEVQSNGILVRLRTGALGMVRRSQLANLREDQRPDRFSRGETIDAMIVDLGQKDPRRRDSNNKIGLSIKQLEIAEEKEAIEGYSSSESGARLGDILGAVILQSQQTQEEKKQKDSAPKTPETPPETPPQSGSENKTETATKKDSPSAEPRVPNRNGAPAKSKAVSQSAAK